MSHTSTSLSQPQKLSSATDYKISDVDSDLVVGIEGNTVVTAPFSWIGKLIQWWKGESIVTDFKKSLGNKYGTSIADYATNGLSTTLTTGMIREALQKAQAAQAAQAAQKTDIEAYKLQTDSKVAAIKKIVTEENNPLVQEAEQAAEQAQAALNLLRFASDEEQANEALRQAKEEARSARARVDAIHDKASLAISQMESINQDLQSRFANIEQEAQKKMDAIRNSSTAHEARARALGGIPTTKTDATQKAINQVQSEATQKNREACLDARNQLAPLETTLAHFTLQQEAAKAREKVVQLRSEEASAEVCNVVATQIDQQIEKANNIITTANQIDAFAQKQLTDHHQAEALNLFETAHIAKVIAINLSSQEAITVTKKDLTQTTREISSLKSNDEFTRSSLEELSSKLASLYTQFLLAEANSPDAALDMAQTAASKLRELAKESIRRATNEPNNSSFYHELEVICQKAANSYDQLAEAESIEIAKALFHQKTSELKTLFPSEAAIRSLEAIESAIDPMAHHRIDDIMNIDLGFPRDARLINFHGNLVALPFETTLSTFNLEEENAYSEGIDLIRLTLAKRFGMNMVKKFDDDFRAQIASKEPVTIEMLERFLDYHEASDDNTFFITQTTSLSALSAELSKASDNQVIKTDKDVSNFNPFTTKTLLVAPKLSSELTSEMEHEQNFAAIRKMITDALNNQNNKDAILTRFDEIFNTSKYEKKPLTVGALKNFIDKETNWTDWLKAQIEEGSPGALRSSILYHIYSPAETFLAKGIWTLGCGAVKLLSHGLV